MRQIHGCDLNQIDLSVCDRQVVKHGLKTRTQPTASFTLVVFTHHIIYTHTRLPTRTNPFVCLFVCCLFVGIDPEKPYFASCLEGSK